MYYHSTLHDEMLIQLIKQTEKNQKDYLVLRLINIIVSCFRVNQHFPIYAAYFYHKVQEEKSVEKSIQMKQILMKMVVMHGQCKRVMLPCQLELESIQEQRKMSVVVRFFNEKAVVVECESHTTMKDVVRWVLRQGRVDEGMDHLFGILEVQPCSEQIGRWEWWRRERV